MNAVVARFHESGLIPHAQFLPKDLMSLLEGAAAEKGLDVNIEVSIRLLATMVNPSAFNRILQKSRVLN